MATSVNYDMDQGSDFSFTLVAKNDDGTPKNIQFDYSVYCQMRKYYSSSTAITLTATTLDDGTSGQIKVSATSSQTSQVKPGVYFYDVELHASSANATEPNIKRRLQQGMITVYPEVTKV
jgi:hypothetical protein